MTPDPVAQFRAALERRGLVPKEIVADGHLHRCPTKNGKPGRQDGVYILHLDGLPAGGFENHRDGLRWETWKAEADGRKPTPAEQAEQRRRIEAARQAREEDQHRRHEEAAARAARLWGISRPATDSHCYLRRKSVKAFGLRLLRDRLVIPARDAAGRLWTLQFIGPDGGKRFLTGGRKHGCYFGLGRVADTICVAEGYATAASVFMATGFATAVAFDAGNLEPVARALRTKFPAVRIIVAADNDVGTPNNPGVMHATAAARAVGGLVAIPQFCGGGA